MTHYILYLSYHDVNSLGLGYESIINAVEDAFRQKGRGLAEMPPKPGIHPRPDSFIHAMPAYLKGSDVAGLKWVSGYPENPKRGIPYITGMFILNDPETGLPLCVMDAAWLTAYRTAAATAVSAKYLARENSEVLAVLGCGTQGKTNTLMLSKILPIKTIKAYDISESTLKSYEAFVKEKTDLSVMGTSSPREAVEGSDIIVTAGYILKEPNPVIEANWIKEGASAFPLDFDSYWKSSAIAAMDKFYTDDVEQLLYYIKEGWIRPVDKISGDLGEVVVGKKPGREKETERIMCMNLGLAILDVAVGKLIYEEALKKGMGAKLPLI
ncbi:MAG: ornithine cyclodeaminase family protein [Thermoproteota archaeon]|jgi:ornithine cyclodeaminase/alanine dehydrogenase|uniref:Ornithine cyclodeaminase family protein n=1 Tax=Candidatus Methanodesulfokora washburnensis TaxID=2478471 RepID=A0A3R9R5V5_9CREN|nr:ornithine cyclodeaminase family protein [Candidatus Methanodesulfokores washburnensis]RSN75550.1 ornithine cyclodeaminase family protein [Candidatus Methanodesulfokores washburnensis]RZN63694.1 MAG: ornithine cyclodeaminase family protein [Candidatus Methanodesulfokores washburnensis]TDA39047.1 MAG: ornithine cyclodeaminase family protein [Candidatus Korarchaeota archaeon]